MKHHRATEEVQESAALYALGALSQHEVRAFDNHLRDGCAVCSEELARFESVVAGVGLGTAETEPPGYLRDLLSARIEREPRRLQSVSPSPTPQVQRPVAPEVRAAGRSRLYVPWGLAASFAILALLSFLAWQQVKEDVARQQDTVQALRNETDQVKARLERESALARELEQIKNVLNTPGSRVILLAGQESALSASAAIFWDTQMNRWVLTGNLPPPPAGKVYQLWFVTPTEKISAGLIKPDPEGHSFATVEVPASVRNLAAAAITLEPEGGSRQPTMPIYALGKVG